MVHFTIVCLIAKPFNRSEAKGDLVLIQTLLLFKCKLLCYHANQILVSITTRSPSASFQIKGLATKYTTVKWPFVEPFHASKRTTSFFFCHDINALSSRKVMRKKGNISKGILLDSTPNSHGKYFQKCKKDSRENLNLDPLRGRFNRFRVINS